MQTFLIFLLVLAFCVLCLEVKVLFSKKGKFPETGIGRNEEMRKRGITCAHQDELDRLNKEHRQSADNPISCGGCSLKELCGANQELKS
ncbi:MAG: hypothetical protein LBF67_05585 [Prevotellaceae bacterium]|jgi:hypothetical protein|nr:hypothetical protein [Prevotellaceae bacterium]